MKLKRIAIAALAAITIATSVMSMPVSASTVDSDFAIVIQTGKTNADTNGKRKKTTTTSTYVNYNKTVGPGSGAASGPAKFRVYVYGSSSATGAMKDCTCYNTSVAAYPVITKGTKGYVKQLVCEQYGANAYALLYGSKYSGTGTARGCWSPDSASESGATYYN